MLQSFVAFARKYQLRRRAATLLLLVGFLVQLSLISILAEIIDLSVSLMELWTELARKHLELLLS